MRVTNHSSVPAAELAAIVKFLGRRFPTANQVALDVKATDPEAPGACFMTGDAYPGGGWAQCLNERHAITVYVPTLQRPYPTWQQNPAGQGACPQVNLQAWQEELVLVLAHELQHVTQFEANDPAVVVADQGQFFEVDAEREAVLALGAWRQRRARSTKTKQEARP